MAEIARRQFHFLTWIKMAGEEENNFNFHTPRKNMVKKKDDNFNFHTWRQNGERGKITILIFTCQAKNIGKKKKTP